MMIKHEIAEYLRVSKLTVIRMMNRGDLPFQKIHKHGPWTHAMTKRDLNQWLKERETKATNPFKFGEFAYLLEQ